MHELSLCQGLMRQVDQVARENEATAVERILLRVGGLSGVESPLLKQAFQIARMGTLAEEAELEIEEGPVVVKGSECGGSSAGPGNRLGDVVGGFLDRVVAQQAAVPSLSNA